MARKISGARSLAIKRLLRLIDRPKHTIHPDDNVLIGAKVILEYMDMKNLGVLYFWVENFAFPAIKRPDNGMWTSSITAIDHWLFMMAAAEARLRQEQGTTRSDKYFDRFERFRQRQRENATNQGQELQPTETVEETDPTTS